MLIADYKRICLFESYSVQIAALGALLFCVLVHFCLYTFHSLYRIVSFLVLVFFLETPTLTQSTTSRERLLTTLGNTTTELMQSVYFVSPHI